MNETTWPDWVVLKAEFTLGTDPETRTIQYIYPIYFIDDKGDSYSHAILKALTSGIHVKSKPTQPSLKLPEWLIPGVWVCTTYGRDIYPGATFKLGSVKGKSYDGKYRYELCDTKDRHRWWSLAQQDVDAIRRVTISPWPLETLVYHCKAKTALESLTGVSCVIDEVRIYSEGTIYVFLSDRSFLTLTQLADTMTLNGAPCGIISLID